MRSVDLARVSLAAELLYLRRLARRQAIRGAFAAATIVFAFLLFGMIHVVLYQAARLYFRPLWSACAVVAVDIVVAGALAGFAMRDTPDAVEVEAKRIERQALAELRRSLTITGMATDVGGRLFRRQITTLKQVTVQTRIGG